MKNKEVINCCENFYDIINFEPQKGDYVTPKIVELYKKYIFDNKYNSLSNKENIVNLDKAIKKYIDDCLFRKDLQLCIKTMEIDIEEEKNAFKAFIERIIDFFVNYNIYTTRIIYISRWI